uniref:Uncharacterized protein n=1 Tax=Human betaherpesvirus 6 TaxID=10368 RepID=A0A649Z388_9BETA|nr:hypothetical protein [Human betaherpesvirus 6]QGM76884.1 hypothetical protein [Human betaherpesvirus 6]
MILKVLSRLVRLCFCCDSALRCSSKLYDIESFELTSLIMFLM